MKKLLFGTFLFIFSSALQAAQWVVLPTTAGIANIQLIQAGNSNGSPEGLYIGLKTATAEIYCNSNGKTIVITDPKLIDRAYSGILYAMSTQKAIQFYVDGPTSCLQNFNIPLATMFTLIP